MDVQLYVYDLSHGLARQISRQFLGIQIDAVYHTSLVFGGIEYFFGRGIQTAYPGSTHHGNPIEVVSLGQTSLPQDLIIDYLESLREIYSPESYDLFAHNCNNFTNDLAQFLVGREIPDHITSLPKTVLDTPFGQMLRPQIDHAMRPVTQAPTGLQPTMSRPNQTPATNGVGQNGVHTEAIKSPSTIGKVQNIANAQQFDQVLEQARESCAIIFFTSSSCAPCKVLYPIYDDLAAEAGSKGVFLKVDVANVREIGMRYSISATPTFITFLKGKQFDRCMGSDAAQLRGNVRILLQAAFPPHSHSSMKLVYLPRWGNTKPVTYGKTPPLQKLKDKMGEQSDSKAVSDMVSFISRRENEKTMQSVSVPDLPSISAFLLRSLDTVPLQSLFTVYDLFRVLLVDPRISGYFLAETSLKTINTLINHVNDLQQQYASSPGVTYNLHLCAIHVACNLFTSNLLSDVLKSPHSTQLSSTLVTLVSGAILNENHSALRVAASSLAYNLAKAENAARVSSSNNDGVVSMLMPDSVQVELAASLVEALSKSTLSFAANDAGDTGAATTTQLAELRYQAIALAHLIYLSPADGDLFDLCDALDLRSTFAQVTEKGTSKPTPSVREESDAEQIAGLLREIDSLLDAR